MKKTIPKKVKGKKENKKLWGGRFKASGTSAAESFNASISFDKRLYRHDIIGSIAQAKVLQRAGVLTAKEVTKIIKGLNSIQKEIETDKFCFRTVDEDIHMAIEKRLTEKIGALGGKLHTGRSRNDQVATDVRLYLKDEGALVSKAIKDLQSALISVAKKNMDAVMPGYTHLQRAQPILFSHHMMAYFEMLKRDAERLGEALKRVDVMPLGSGALAGSPYKLDRAYAAKLLKFSKVSANSLDAVSDRDFLIEFQSVASIIMVHISRLSEELILWSSSEFGFVEISDEFSTGSSIMPQKKNPDMAELARGKSGRVIGNLVSMLTVMKSLPLAYNKDMQEDKEPLFDTVDTLKAVLDIFTPMLKSMKVNKKRMREATAKGFITATDVADYLTQGGMPFRKAHEVVGKAVAFCIDKGIELSDVKATQWKKFSKSFGDDIIKVVTVDSSVKARSLYGGTAPKEVKKQITRALIELKKK